MTNQHANSTNRTHACITSHNLMKLEEESGWRGTFPASRFVLTTPKRTPQLPTVYSYGSAAIWSPDAASYGGMPPSKVST
jgi:hypothetical protein